MCPAVGQSGVPWYSVGGVGASQAPGRHAAFRLAVLGEQPVQADAPQALFLQRHLVLPALVEPFFFIIPWHLGHRGVSVPPIRHIRTARMPCAATGPRRFRTHILAGLESDGMRIRNRDTPGGTSSHTRFRTHILANNPLWRDAVSASLRLVLRV